MQAVNIHHLFDRPPHFTTNFLYEKLSPIEADLNIRYNVHTATGTEAVTVTHPFLLSQLQILLEEVTGVVLLCHPQLEDMILGQSQSSCK